MTVLRLYLRQHLIDADERARRLRFPRFLRRQFGELADQAAGAIDRNGNPLERMIAHGGVGRTTRDLGLGLQACQRGLQFMRSVGDEGPMPDAAWLEQQLTAGTLTGIGELVFNYAGIAPDDSAMADYWALAARHDVPTFVHIGRGPAPGQGPRRHEGCYPQYQADFGDPSLLRPVLERHPRLRMVLQHAGFDYLDETLSLLRDFPNVFVDMSVLNSVGPRALHDASLHTLVSAGYADRIVLGSDDQDYAAILERIEGASFLTPAQRRGIYYDNAARFLRLDRATIASDYGR